MEDVARRRDDLKPAHVVARDAVLDGAHAVGVGADVTGLEEAVPNLLQLLFELGPSPDN